MAVIPMGQYAQANVVPRADVSRVDLSATRAAGTGAQAIAEGLGDAATAVGNVAQRQLQEERQAADAMARAQAFNAAMDDELETTVIVSDLRQRVADGSLDWRKAAEEYESRQNKRATRTISDLDPADVERYHGVLKRQRFAGLADVQGIVAGARRTEFRSQFDAALDTLGKLAGEPSADIDKLHARAEAFIPLAEQAGIDRSTIQAKIQTFRDRNWQNQATGRILAERDNLQGLEAIEQELTAEDGFYAGKLDTDKRNVLVSQVLGRKDQLQRRIEADSNKTEAAAERALTKFEAQIGTGVMAPVETMREWNAAVTLGTDEQRSRFQDLLKGEAELRQVRKLPPEQQRAYVTQLRTRQQAEGATVTDVANLRRMETTIEADLRRLKDSPLEYDAILTGQDVPALDVQALVQGEPSRVRGLLEDRMVRLARMRKQYGPETGSALLLPAEASAIGAVLREAGTRQTAQLFGMLNGIIRDPAAYQATLQQLAPDSPVRALAGRLYAAQRVGGPPAGEISVASPKGEYGDVAMLLLKGETLLNPGNGASGQDGKPSAFPMPPPADVEREIAKRIGTAFAGRSAEFQTTVQAVRAYYAARSADEGDVKGELDAGRLDLAVRAVAGQKVRFEGRDVMPPWGMPADEFQDKADVYVQARLRAAKLQDPGDVALMNVRGRDNVYVLVRGIEPLVDGNGQPLVIRIGGQR